MNKILLLAAALAVVNVGIAFELDNFAISDDDNPHSYGTTSSNYAINGYYDEDNQNSETIGNVKHDYRQGIQSNENSEGQSLKLQGVSKDDLEDLYFGRKLLKESRK
ncbi:MAG: hypothetical protein GX278_00435 [Aeromonadales bacterium]|nr:hypothetical protein [Aeromonadales bacterium]